MSFPRSLAAAHAALGAWLRASAPPILLLGAQACVGWAGGAARPSRIAPTPQWCPPVRLRMSRRLPEKCPVLAAGACDRPRALRPPNCCPASSCATRTRLHRSDRANMHRAAALHQRGWSVVLLCNGFWLAPGPLCSAWPLHLTSPTNAPASVTRTHLHLSDRTNVHRAAAPIGGAARCRPTFVTAVASDSPYSQSGLCVSRVPPTRPRRRSTCACASGHAPIRWRCLIPLRRPDRTAKTVSCPETVVPPGRVAKRANPNPWRLTRSCTASGHAPTAQAPALQLPPVASD